MTKRPARKRESEVVEFTPARPKRAPPLEAKTNGQHIYMQNIRGHKLVFGLGPAGTGKTYIATAMAIEALQTGETNRIIITRPAVDCEEELGFLPGSQDEKFEPYLVPVLDVLNERLGSGNVSGMIKSGRIVGVPLGKLRGRTLNNCWVVADEMQNATPGQMKMLLTRIGRDCKMIVNGDTDQKDISGLSGLLDAYNRFGALAEVGIHMMNDDDIVRSGLIREILARYRD